MSELLSLLAGALVASVVALAIARRSNARMRADAQRAEDAALALRDEAIRRGERELAKAKDAAAAEVAALRAKLRAIETVQQMEARGEDWEQSRVEPRPAEMARALARELATIVSGIEGGTFRLVESSPALRAQGDAVESLWLAVRRLRRFHGKVAGFAQMPQANPGSTPIDKLLESLREELNANALGLRISWHLPQPSLRLYGDPDDLLSALTLATTALHHLERGALRLEARVEPCFERETPEVHIELALERDEGIEDIAHPQPPGAAFLIARAAASHILRAYGARVSFSHEPSHEARALVQIPLLTSDGSEDADSSATFADQLVDATPAPEPVIEIPRTHRYGGVLVLEEDATVRSMLAAELRAQGRAVFACPDGAAARSLIQATPDRFEFLVVDHPGRLDAGDMLAATAARLCPDLRIVVLSDANPSKLPSALAPHVTSIPKPFGVQELRKGLAAALTV